MRPLLSELGLRLRLLALRSAVLAGLRLAAELRRLARLALRTAEVAVRGLLSRLAVRLLALGCAVLAGLLGLAVLRRLSLLALLRHAELSGLARLRLTERRLLTLRCAVLLAGLAVRLLALGCAVLAGLLGLAVLRRLALLALLRHAELGGRGARLTSRSTPRGRPGLARGRRLPFALGGTPGELGLLPAGTLRLRLSAARLHGGNRPLRRLRRSLLRCFGGLGRRLLGLTTLILHGGYRPLSGLRLRRRGLLGLGGLGGGGLGSRVGHGSARYPTNHCQVTPPPRLSPDCGVPNACVHLA